MRNPITTFGRSVLWVLYAALLRIFFLILEGWRYLTFYRKQNLSVYKSVCKVILYYIPTNIGITRGAISVAMLVVVSEGVGFFLCCSNFFPAVLTPALAFLTPYK